MISIILSVFADAGNLINLFVLTRRHMRSTMTTLLVTLSWADLVPPTVASLNSIFYYHLLPHMNKSSAFLTTNLIARDFFNGFANIFTTFSNWLIVIITTFRLIVVKVKDSPWIEGNFLLSLLFFLSILETFTRQKLLQSSFSSFCYHRDLSSLHRDQSSIISLHGY